MDQKLAMKILPAAALALLLAACGGEETPEEQTVAEADRIECAVGGAETFERVCSIERMASAEGLTLTLRSPNGSFRRLLVTTDGRGVVAADGAEPAAVTPLSDNRIEVAIAGDRYRLPATVKR
jgi:hypothetical protein